MKKIKGFICRTNKKPFIIEMHDHTIIDKLLIESITLIFDLSYKNPNKTAEIIPNVLPIPDINIVLL